VYLCDAFKKRRATATAEYAEYTEGYEGLSEHLLKKNRVGSLFGDFLLCSYSVNIQQNGKIFF
jgi:hypothetical protein